MKLLGVPVMESSHPGCLFLPKSNQALPGNSGKSSLRGAGWERETAATAKSFSLIFHTERKAKSAGKEGRASKLAAQGSG